MKLLTVTTRMDIPDQDPMSCSQPDVSRTHILVCASAYPLVFLLQ